MVEVYGNVWVIFVVLFVFMVMEGFFYLKRNLQVVIWELVGEDGEMFLLVGKEGVKSGLYFQSLDCDNLWLGVGSFDDFLDLV